MYTHRQREPGKYRERETETETEEWEWGVIHRTLAFPYLSVTSMGKEFKYV